MASTLVMGVPFVMSSNLPLAKSKSQSQNIVFILADDLGWTDLGCYGSTFYETPNIDKIAATGMKFTAGYAASPVSSPTRASILTGKYPARLHLTNWLHGKIKKQLIGASYVPALSLHEITIAETLKKHNYTTFFAGKWHLGAEKYWPEYQGFDVNIGGCDWGGPYGGKNYFSPYANPRLTDGPKGEHLPDRLAEETVQFIQSNRDKPFFAYLSFYSVHTPLMARKDLEEKYSIKKEQKAPKTSWGKEGEYKVRKTQNDAVYAGMVEAMDQAVGKVLVELDKQGLTDKTIVVFMSDNGGMSTCAGYPTSNIPLRAGKGWLYEGGVREPFIIKWPGVTPPGSTCDVPVISTDFYPTLLEMTDLPFQHDQHLDGISLVPLLKNKGEISRDAIYWHFPHYSPQGGTPSAAVRVDNYKLIEFFEDNHVELYDLKQDIGELKDISKNRPRMTSKLKDMLHLWLKQVDAKMVIKNNEYKEPKKQNYFLKLIKRLKAKVLSF
ncbi:MAG: sulfatase [Desulfobulbaceae bacterium]|nr:sulfatase [Desulfobulbaceae bacterium]